ncbi:hypothetical protein SFB4_050G5, partial [Candidatus Arthromitus sp. SFB-4]
MIFFVWIIVNNEVRYYIKKYRELMEEL